MVSNLKKLAIGFLSFPNAPNIGEPQKPLIEFNAVLHPTTFL